MGNLPRGYDFYFALSTSMNDSQLNDSEKLITFPITPSELKISSSSRNETIDLIDDGEINILKSPSLIEIEFDARFPMREYPYSRIPLEFQEYFDVFAKLKTNKQPFRFIVSRASGVTKSPYETNLLVSLEDFSTDESADEGDDIICSFKLKQYKPYGVKKYGTAYPTSGRDTGSTGRENQTYTVAQYDTLSLIAKKLYGDASLWKSIYNANKNVIENAAKAHGRQSSQNGHWIYPGTKLIVLPKKNSTFQTLTAG